MDSKNCQNYRTIYSHFTLNYGRELMRLAEYSVPKMNSAQAEEDGKG